MNRVKSSRPELYIVNLQWTPKDNIAKLKINGNSLDISTPFYFFAKSRHMFSLASKFEILFVTCSREIAKCRLQNESGTYFHPANLSILL